MKLYKNLLIPILVLAILAGVFLAVRVYLPSSVEEESLLIKLADYSEDDLKKIVIYNDGKQYIIEKNKKNTWILVEPEINVAGAKLDTLIYELGAVYAKRLIEEDAKDLSDYGLDKPNTFQLHLKNGSVKEYHIGNKAPTGEGYYLIEKDSKKVYLMDRYKADIILTDFIKLSDTTLVSITSQDFLGLKNYKNGVLVYDLQAGVKSEWNVVAPIQAQARLYVVEELIDSLKNIQIDGYVSDSVKTLAKYGLDKPRYSFLVRGKRGNAKVDLGLQNQNGMYYGRFKDSDKVFLVSPAKIPFIDKRLEDLVMNTITFQDITALNKFEIILDGKKELVDVTFKKGEEKDYERYLYNKQDVTYLQDEDANPLLKTLYESIQLIEWYELDLKTKPAYSDPDFTIRYYPKKGKPYEISLVEKNENYYYTFKNKRYTGLIVDKKYLDPVRDNNNKLKKEAERRLGK